MDGGDAGGGAFGGSGGGPDAPGPGAPYGWFLIGGGFFALMGCLGAVSTGSLFMLGLSAIGLAVVAIGLYERHKGTRAWDRD